jgi:hypothetical protein
VRGDELKADLRGFGISRSGSRTVATKRGSAHRDQLLDFVLNGETATRRKSRGGLPVAVTPGAPVGGAFSAE